MPLVAHNDLPTFQVLKDRGRLCCPLNRANEQDIRELHIGFLNMMPDAALAATERQFIRMVGSSNPIAQFYVYPFTIPELARSDAAMRHIDKYYFSSTISPRWSRRADHHRRECDGPVARPGSRSGTR